jgi:hypothetical protein
MRRVSLYVIGALAVIALIAVMVSAKGNLPSDAKLRIGVLVRSLSAHSTWLYCCATCRAGFLAVAVPSGDVPTQDQVW